MNTLSKFINFFAYLFEVYMSTSPFKISKWIMFSGLTLIVGFNLMGYLKYGKLEISLIYNDSPFVTYVALILIGIGLILSVISYFTLLFQGRNNVLFYIKGMSNMNIKAPEDALSGFERSKQHSEEYEVDSYNKNDLKLKYEEIKNDISRRKGFKNAEKIYIATLGSFPLLFLLGYLTRNSFLKVEILDYNRHSSNGGKWYKLDKFYFSDVNHEIYNSDLTIKEEIERLKNLENDEVGIALAYTFNIEKSSIPSNLQDKTLYLKNSLDIGHDKLSNKDIQKQLLQEISLYMGELSNTKKKIHLFVSAQASMCVNLGKSYMEKTHANIYLYHIDKDTNKQKFYFDLDSVK